jgi:hypothetical protein
VTSQAAKFQDLQIAFARHLRDPDQAPLPEGVSDRRAAVYRELFFANIEGALGRAFPVARELLGEAQWIGLVRGFWREHRSHSPEFPRVPGEFLDWFFDRESTGEREPPFLGELLIWEHAELKAMLAPDDPKYAQASLWEDCPVLSNSLEVHAFAFPVQQICLDWQPDSPAEEPQFLACYRTRSLNVDFMTLSAGAAWLIQHMAESPEEPGYRHVSALAEATGLAPDLLAAEGRNMLEDFLRRGIIIGAQQAPESKD